MNHRTLVVLLGFVIYVNGQYENYYCDMCPINLRLRKDNNVDVCSMAVYSCTCSCSSGCVLSNKQNVDMGYKITNLNIEEVTKQINACSSCFILWNTWDCNLQSVYDVFSIKFDACQHSSDFIKYNKNCAGNTFVSPSPVGFERYSPSIVRSPSPKVEVVSSPMVMSPSPKVEVVSSPAVVRSPSPKVELVSSPVVRSPSPKVDVVSSPMVRSPSPKVDVVSSPALVKSPTISVVSSSPMVMSSSPKVDVIVSPTRISDINTTDIKQLDEILIKNIGIEISQCMQYKADKCSPFECDDCTVDENNFILYCDGLVGIMDSFTSICANKESYMIYKHTLVNTKLNFTCQQNITYDVSSQLELLTLYVDKKCNSNKKITSDSIIKTTRFYVYVLLWIVTLSLIL